MEFIVHEAEEIANSIAKFSGSHVCCRVESSSIGLRSEAFLNQTGLQFPVVAATEYLIEV